jgi:hypothetical protein
MALQTLTGVAKFGPHVRTELIEEAVKVSPEISVLPWKTVPGYTYSTLVRTADPTVTFRAVNSGIASTCSTYTNRTITTAILNPRIEVDKAVADACADGAEIYMAKETLGAMRAALYQASKVLWYGTSATLGDTNGFTGLQGQVDSTMLVDATGTTANTGSSVYIVAADPVDNLTWVLGGAGAFEISEVRTESIFDGSYQRYSAYVADGVFWVGAQLGHAKAISRIKNVTADTGKGLTDSLLYDALATFPVTLKPSAIFMSRRSLGQLRKSRTATNATGAPAPLPTECEGIPIYVTEAIVNTEAIA